MMTHSFVCTRILIVTVVADHEEWVVERPSIQLENPILTEIHVPYSLLSSPYLPLSQCHVSSSQDLLVIVMCPFFRFVDE